MLSLFRLALSSIFLLMMASSSYEQCVSPQAHSCAFYSTCLEAHFNCGTTGYPLAYGEHYCGKFSTPPNLSRFTDKGQQWMWDTMHCLQTALVPELEKPSGPNACEKLEDKAFDTHAGCYVESGLCTLSPQDWFAIMEIVGLKSLFGSWDALEQSIEAAGACAEFYLGIVKEKLKDLFDIGETNSGIREKTEL